MTFIRNVLPLCFVMLLLESSLGTEQVLRCEQIPSDSTHTTELTRGKTGKKGPKGDPGIRGVAGPKGGVGPMGPRGEPGDIGATGTPGVVDYGRIESYINAKQRTFTSCSAIKSQINNAPNGLYDIKDDKGSLYRTYCDMSIGGGGWTLVASVHENFIEGKCTTGDRWSSEHGNNPLHPHGDGAWENTAMFGAPESAASDDYKNQGYFNMAARDVMIWHVPNNTPLEHYKDRSFMMYHSTSGFMRNYGGNMYSLFKDHFPLRHGVYQKTSGNGPSPAVVWDRGSNQLMVQNTAPSARGEISAGFIQFRAINNEKSAFAICPGVKIKPTAGNVEHMCIGGTSNHGESPRQCGDFASKDWNGYGTGVHWSSNRAMTESVVMIFYR